jgi:hypothetical protein
MTTVITLTIAIVLITLMFCITLHKNRVAKAAYTESENVQNNQQKDVKKHAFAEQVNSELSDEQKQALLSVKDQVKAFKMQVKINKIDGLVSKLNSPDISEQEKLVLAEQITQAVDSTLQGEETQVKKQNFKVIQGWGASMKVG